VLDIFRRKEYVITVDARSPKEVVQQEIRSKLGLPPFTPAKSAAETVSGAVSGAAQ
jgi:adenylate kinase